MIRSRRSPVRRGPTVVPRDAGWNPGKKVVMQTVRTLKRSPNPAIQHTFLVDPSRVGCSNDCVNRCSRASDTVSKASIDFKSWHDWDRHVLHDPHPNPLPEGEGAKVERFALPSPSGRGTEGEGIRATILVAQRVLRHSHPPVATVGQPLRGSEVAPNTVPYLLHADTR